MYCTAPRSPRKGRLRSFRDDDDDDVKEENNLPAPKDLRFIGLLYVSLRKTKEDLYITLEC